MQSFLRVSILAVADFSAMFIPPFLKNKTPELRKYAYSFYILSISG
jgi:hypothetical protein